ncbi:hypothetical protein HC776_02305 [bacterium]|nr:hypothetical protein [bacterium]
MLLLTVLVFKVTVPSVASYAAATRSGLTVENVTPVTQSGKEGFRVAYTLTTLEGETESGAMVLLNSTNMLHVANLRLPASGNVNLNDATAAAPYADTLKVLDSFAVYEGQNVSVSQ